MEGRQTLAISTLMKAQTLRCTFSLGPSEKKGADVLVLLLEMWLQWGASAGESLSRKEALLDLTQASVDSTKRHFSYSSVTFLCFSPSWFFLSFAERLVFSREKGLDLGGDSDSNEVLFVFQGREAYGLSCWLYLYLPVSLLICHHYSLVFRASS